jgi:hypothetical protein
MSNFAIKEWRRQQARGGGTIAMSMEWDLEWPMYRERERKQFPTSVGFQFSLGAECRESNAVRPLVFRNVEGVGHGAS